MGSKDIVVLKDDNIDCYYYLMYLLNEYGFISKVEDGYVIDLECLSGLLEKYTLKCDGLVEQLKLHGGLRKKLEKQNMELLDEIVRLKGEVSLLSPVYDLPDLSIEHNVIKLNRDNRILKNMVLDNSKEKGLVVGGDVISLDDYLYLKNTNLVLEKDYDDLKRIYNNLINAYNDLTSNTNKEG